MSTRRFALLLGLFFVRAGIAGFLPFLAHPEAGTALAGNMIAPPPHGGAILGTGDDMLFGLFPVNAAHNAVHLLFGLWGLAASRTRRGSSSMQICLRTSRASAPNSASIIQAMCLRAIRTPSASS